MLLLFAGSSQALVPLLEGEVGDALPDPLVEVELVGCQEGQGTCLQQTCSEIAVAGWLTAY